jgi:hypothetical protein
MVQCPEIWFLAKMLFAPLQDFKLRQDKSKIIRLEFNCVVLCLRQQTKYITQL